MVITLTEPAEKQFKRLPAIIKEKVKRQFTKLLENPHHPSLHIKKMKNVDFYEGRISIHYRFRFLWRGNHITIISIGQHDVGLGKK